MPNILDALDDALAGKDDLDEVIGGFYQLAQQVDDATRTKMLESLEPRLREHSPEKTGGLAVLAGAFVELGGDPAAFPPAVFDHLLEALKGTDPESEDDQPEWYYDFERAAMACLSCSAEIRKNLPQRQALLANIKRYRERYGFLGKMLHVLDGEPLVVIHLPTQRGFRFTIGGIADNFQLHGLVLVALSREIPDMKVTPGASKWQLANWFALRPGNEIDAVDYNQSWVWNEGTPSDIAVLDGQRILLVGPSTIQRSWNTGRVFGNLKERFDGPQVMSAEEITALLAKIEREVKNRTS